MSSFRYLRINSNIPLLANNLIDGVISRNYALKSDLKIKWVRPEKVPFYKPQNSGDLQSFPEINRKQFLLEFQNSKELQTADENVKKLFTLEFAPKKFTNKVFYKSMEQRVKRHEYDYSSIEVKLARWTGVIRAQQELIEKFPRNKWLKIALKELIDKRTKHLRYLRRWDYKKFEWLLETLDLVYKPLPTEPFQVTRKDSLQRLTGIYVDNIKSQRLEKYRLQLESEQPAFLEEKIRNLQYIRDEQKACGVEVTVTFEEIEQVKQKLEDLKAKNEKRSSELENE
ncbi:unnamed protein product [Phyllotreta striolata]|uniref:Small ribosomal subunit protein uS15m n=1 Tax=Phyllotreta striolata TaxID=444603 RepID=A0A9N9TWC9_PHYSR|nr:unnamed protein product [Phyllotreta striolata]